MTNCIEQEYYPLVLVHGLWDTPQLFDKLLHCLGGNRWPILRPYLPSQLGKLPIFTLAKHLDQQIRSNYGASGIVDLLGFSMGGIIARTWIQHLGGYRRLRRFISVGSPQNGSLLASAWPGELLRGIADLKPNSALLNDLNNDFKKLSHIDCCSFYCVFDLMVLPGWRATLPIGRSYSLPVWSHQQLMTHQGALQPLTKELLKDLED